MGLEDWQVELALPVSYDALERTVWQFFCELHAGDPEEMMPAAWENEGGAAADGAADGGPGAAAAAVHALAAAHVAAWEEACRIANSSLDVASQGRTLAQRTAAQCYHQLACAAALARVPLGALANAPHGLVLHAGRLANSGIDVASQGRSIARRTATQCYQHLALAAAFARSAHVHAGRLASEGVDVALGATNLAAARTREEARRLASLGVEALSSAPRAARSAVSAAARARAATTRNIAAAARLTAAAV